MYRKAAWICAISLILGGCYNGVDHSAIFSEARASNRPIVSFVPMIDTSKSDLNWNVSQELTKAIRERLSQRNQVYMVGEQPVAALSEKALSAHDPFDIDTSWVRRAFPENEFVVFMQLMEHAELPTMSAQDSPTLLMMSVRLRIFDVREKTPKVVLQEIVEQSHHVPSQLTDQVVWGDEAFDVSFLGIAHDQLCKELATRVEDYILIAGAKK